MTKKDTGIVDNRIRPWFPIEHVIKSTIEIYEELLSLKITKMEN